MEKEIASRYGVTQQAVSKAILKHVRDLPAREAELLRMTHTDYLASMHEMVSQAYERAQNDKIFLKLIGIALDLMEREAKLLGLDAETRNPMERPRDSHVPPTIWNLLAQAGPTDLETIKRIQELDPIEKPDHAKSTDGLGPVDD